MNRYAALMTLAASMTLVAFSSPVPQPGYIEGGAVHPSVAEPTVVNDFQMPSAFTMSMWLRGGQDGFVAGHPGRVWIGVEGDEIAFHVGGDYAIAGIFRDDYRIALPIDIEEWTFVAASFDAEGRMTLAASTTGSPMRMTRGYADMAVMEQLDMMEELVGGVRCSQNLYVGGTVAECAPDAESFGGQVNEMTVIPRVVPPSELVAAAGC